MQCLALKRIYYFEEKEDLRAHITTIKVFQNDHLPLLHQIKQQLMAFDEALKTIRAQNLQLLQSEDITLASFWDTDPPTLDKLLKGKLLL